MFWSFIALKKYASGIRSHMSTDNVSPLINQLFSGTVSEEIVFHAMGKFKNKFTSGPDQFPSFLIKDCAISDL